MVRRMTGLGRSTIYRMEADGQFPPRIKLGMRAVGWLERDVRCVPFRCDRTVIPAEPRNQNAAGHRQRYTRACRQQGAISVLASLLHCSKAIGQPSCRDVRRIERADCAGGRCDRQHYPATVCAGCGDLRATELIRRLNGAATDLQYHVLKIRSDRPVDGGCGDVSRL